ncbi:MAG: hypothetical protein M0T84_07870 [Betaproteobacteria bacterium]|nr:hypothetical protein [Betaproteobacteria bacterium]
MDYVRRGEIPDATNALSTLYVQMEQDYQDNNNYSDPNNASQCAVGATPAATKFFTYQCTLTNSGQNYSITATGDANALVSQFTYTITDQNIQSSTVPAGLSGWSNPSTNCWVTNKGGQC